MPFAFGVFDTARHRQSNFGRELSYDLMSHFDVRRGNRGGLILYCCISFTTKCDWERFVSARARIGPQHAQSRRGVGMAFRAQLPTSIPCSHAGYCSSNAFFVPFTRRINSRSHVHSDSRQRSQQIVVCVHAPQHAIKKLAASVAGLACSAVMFVSSTWLSALLVLSHVELT
jgi:hypothetical protein